MCPKKPTLSQRPHLFEPQWGMVTWILQPTAAQKGWSSRTNGSFPEYCIHRMKVEKSGFLWNNFSEFSYVNMVLEFPGGLAVKDSAVVTAVVWVQPLAWELPHAMGSAKKKKKEKKQTYPRSLRVYCHSWKCKGLTYTAFTSFIFTVPCFPDQFQ